AGPADRKDGRRWPDVVRRSTCFAATADQRPGGLREGKSLSRFSRAGPDALDAPCRKHGAELFDESGGRLLEYCRSVQWLCRVALCGCGLSVRGGVWPRRVRLMSLTVVVCLAAGSVRPALWRAGVCRRGPGRARAPGDNTGWGLPCARAHWVGSALRFCEGE